MKQKRLLSMLLALVMVIGLALPAGAVQLNIHAPSAVVMDYQTGEILYAKDPDTARVPASMTKVLTAYIMYEEMARGNLSKTDLVTISPHVAQISRDRSYPQPVPLNAGGTYSVDELLNLIMIPSASASCIAIAEHISGSEQAFVKRMNETAKSFGMDATYYNCHGARVNYITARSMAILVRKFIQDYPDILNYTRKSSYNFRGHTYGNTNHLLDTMYYEGADGFKTGTIAAAGYCVATTATRNNRRIISIVMKSSSTSQRFVDSRILLDYGFAEVARRDAAREKTYLKELNVPAQAIPYMPMQVSVQIGGVTTPYTCQAEWTVNGKPVPKFVNPASQITDRKISTLTYTPSADEIGTTLSIGFTLKFPNGKTVERTMMVPVAESMELSGQLNLRTASVYGGHSLSVQGTITSQLTVPEMTLPVQWELNGMPIAEPNTVTLKNGMGISTADFEIPTSLIGEKAEVALVVDPMGTSPLRLTADIKVVD